METIEKKQNLLLEKYKKDEKAKNLINGIAEAFNFILFWDNVRDVKNFKNLNSIKDTVYMALETLNSECNLKKTELELAEMENVLTKQIKSDLLNKDLFLDKFSSNDFNISIKKIKEEDNLYYCYLNHSIRMPYVYSDTAINKVFNENEMVVENKLKVAFYMLSVVITRDIIEGNFRDIYFLDFASSLLNKPQKMNSTLEAISNSMIQEKICLNITYEDYINNKSIIVDYMKNGFKFSITLDDYLKDIEEIKELQLFRYLILDKRIRLYNNIITNKSQFTNFNIIEQ